MLMATLMAILAIGCTHLNVDIPDEVGIVWRGGFLVDPENGVEIERTWTDQNGVADKITVRMNVKEKTQNQALVSLELLRAARELAAAAEAMAAAGGGS